jgi:hypothetical protein
MTAYHQRPHPPASDGGASPIFAHDGNLGFPTDDPPWREFFDRHGISVAAYHDMAKLRHELEAEVKACSYLPAANYYYIRDDPSYEAVASALYAADQTPTLTSLLVVRESSGITAIDQLQGLRLGYASRGVLRGQRTRLNSHRLAPDLPRTFDHVVGAD